MRAAPVLLGFALACSGSPAKTTEPEGSPDVGVAAYVMGSGTFEGSGTIATADRRVDWTITVERSCEDRGGTTRCKSTFTRDAGGEKASYTSHTEVRPEGEVEVYFKDGNGERTTEELLLPAPDRLPHTWTRSGTEGKTSTCRATRSDAGCAGGIRMLCETPVDEQVVIVDSRLLCPDKLQGLHRHVGTYTILCEQLMDMRYNRWRGADMANSEGLATGPKGCDRFSPLGWIRQTPNRGWSVAMPGRGRMVLGPNKWTVNLHQSDMSYIAYEGTGPNASVQTDADVPAMAAMTAQSIAPMLGAEVGEPKKREGGPYPVDWVIPLTKGGKFAGALRLIGRDGVMHSLTTTGADEAKANTFLESLRLHDDGFGEAAAREFDAYVEKGATYKDKVCACPTIDCARAVPDLTAPTLGFPSPKQEETLAELTSAINDCASRLMGTP